ncbi:tripartite tricarboxylate transporter substrate-binding protein, partial [Staphylococcus aureus]|nr:tripartite tricarboxylate transporter substrate-binding protein [Staphylococcus aureus]
SSWVGLFAPAGTPSSVIERMNSDINKVLRSSSVTARMKEIGYIATGSTVAAMNSLIDKQGNELGQAVRKINLALD